MINSSTDKPILHENQAVATAFSLLLRFVWECVKMASNRIYVNAKDKLQQGDKTTYGKTENKDRSQK